MSMKSIAGIYRIAPEKHEKLWKTVRDNLTKSDEALKAAGDALLKLKADHDLLHGTWAEWERLVRDKAGIGKSRASELMRIAGGETTAEEVRADTADRVAKHEAAKQEAAKQVSPLANGGNAGDREVAAALFKRVTNAEGEMAHWRQDHPQYSDQVVGEWLERGENAGDPATSAEIMKVQFSLLDAGPTEPQTVTIKVKEAETPETMTVPAHVTVYDSPLDAAWARASTEQKSKFVSAHWDEIRESRSGISVKPSPTDENRWQER